MLIFFLYITGETTQPKKGKRLLNIGNYTYYRKCCSVSGVTTWSCAYVNTNGKKQEPCTAKVFTFNSSVIKGTEPHNHKAPIKVYQKKNNRFIKKKTNETSLQNLCGTKTQQEKQSTTKQPEKEEEAKQMEQQKETKEQEIKETIDQKDTEIVIKQKQGKSDKQVKEVSSSRTKLAKAFSDEIEITLDRTAPHKTYHKKV